MNYNEFVRRLREELGPDFSAGAEKVAEVSLEVLGERLPRVHRQHLAAQLPAELKAPLLRAKRTENFPLEKYYDRVAARAGIRFHDAERGCQAVMRVMQAAASPGELDDFLSGIPHEYSVLFGRTHPGLVPPRIDTHPVGRTNP